VSNLPKDRNRRGRRVAVKVTDRRATIAMTAARIQLEGKKK